MLPGRKRAMAAGPDDTRARLGALVSVFIDVAVATAEPQSEQ